MILRTPETESADRLDRLSDLLSPIVIKEVRQMVRGREFNYSFTLSVVAGLLVALYTGMYATTGTEDYGVGIFAALMACLTVVGVVIAPMGAFNALRNERMERTLDLVTVTTLSPRRIVIGKLMAQAVKLATLFAALAPFVAMSFLLGGIDFLTIVLSLAAVFLWSLWACAAALFLSCLSRSRAISGLIFGGMIILLLFVIGTGGMGFFLVRTVTYGPGYGGPPISSAFVTGGTDLWWGLAGMTLVCVVSMVNLILLAENRLLLPTEDRSTALRIGFFVQFLLIIGVAVFQVSSRPTYLASLFANMLGVLGGLQLAGVALFSVTEELVLSRRIHLQNKNASGWRRYLAIFRPGGARGAAYILAQMALFLAVGAVVLPISGWEFSWLVAICGYICFFTGVPACAGRILSPRPLKPVHLRVGALLLFPVATLLPDFLVYLVTGDFGGIYSLRHVLDPIRTLSAWSNPTTTPWHFLSLGLGVIGVASYLILIRMGRRASSANETAH